MVNNVPRISRRFPRENFIQFLQSLVGGSQTLTVAKAIYKENDESEILDIEMHISRYARYLQKHYKPTT